MGRELGRGALKVIDDPTAYPDVNSALGTMRDRIGDVLGSHFIGFYACGSLALGDFDPETSDIDAVIVTDGDLDQQTVQALKDMHAEVFENGSYWIRRIELSYTPLEAMKAYDPAHPPRPGLYKDGDLRPVRHGEDWVLHRHVLREQGIIVAGAHPRTMIDPVSREEMRQAVAVGILQNFWEARVLPDPTPLEHDDAYQAYATLTMCRALFTMETGQVASKKQSAMWARDVLDEPFKSLAERVVAWKLGGRMNAYDSVIDFIRYTVESTRAEGLYNFPIHTLIDKSRSSGPIQ